MSELCRFVCLALGITLPGKPYVWASVSAALQGLRFRVEGLGFRI